MASSDRFRSRKYSQRCKDFDAVCRELLYSGLTIDDYPSHGRVGFPAQFVIDLFQQEVDCLPGSRHGEQVI